MLVLCMRSLELSNMPFFSEACQSLHWFDFIGNLIISLKMIMWSFSFEGPSLSLAHNCNHGDRTEVGKEHRSVPCGDCMMDDLKKKIFKKIPV